MKAIVVKEISASLVPALVNGFCIHPTAIVQTHAIPAVGVVAEVGSAVPVSGCSQQRSDDVIAGPDQRVHHRCIRSSTRMRLHVGEFGAEVAFDPVDGDGLNAVDVFAAAVVAPPRRSTRGCRCLAARCPPPWPPAPKKAGY